MPEELKRAQRAADTAGARRRRGTALYVLEAGPEEYALAIRFGGLREDQVVEKRATSAALGRLLRAGLIALLHEDAQRRR